MNKLLSVFIFFFTFGVYLHTLTPGIGLDDSGELTICAYLLSIAHAPGYPLYLLLGKMFTFLPFGEVAFRLNLASATFGALSCTFVFLVVFFLTQHRLSSLISSFCLGSSYIFWTLSTKTEVYTLNTFLVSLLIFIFLIWTQKRNIRWLYLFSFIYGLSLGNHLTILLFLPIFLYFIWCQKWLIPSILFLIGLSIYLYIPIRSFGDIIVINWSKVTTLSHFFNYITGAHFKKLIFSSSFFEVIKHLWNYFLLLITQFPAFVFSIGIIGLIKSFSINRRFSILISLMWLFLIIFCINYNIGDIWNLYLPTYLFFSLFIGLGIYFLIKITLSHHRIWIMIIIIVSLFLSYLLTYSWSGYKFNKSKYFFPFDFCSQILSSVNHNSLIISNWSYATCFWYCQEVCHIRKDIKILSCKNENNFKIIIKKYPSYHTIYTIHPQQEYFLILREEVFKICKKELRNVK
ncbi:MAG: DUF2723 domain-containing protein [bacterium]